MPVHAAVTSAAKHTAHGLDFWFGIGKLARHTQEYVDIYGASGLFLPYILSHDVFSLAQSILHGVDEDTLLKTFCDNQVKETSVVAMIVSTETRFAASD